MSKSEDYPPGLTDSGKEIFITFDIIDNPGATVRKAREEIFKKLHTKLPHRTTITPVFKVGLELFREDPLVLTDERINEIREKVGYGVPSSRVVELYRLYLLWKAYRHKKIVDIDLILSTLRERRLKVWFLLLQHWDEEEIAGKLGVSLKDVQYDKEEAEKELVSKIREETMVEQNQFMLNLPPWVNQAQWEHLGGREQRDELGGMDIITYPSGIGIRQQLDLFKGCFPEIDSRTQSLCRPLDDEIVMAQLHGHLPDEAFWDRAKDFWQKARKCDALRDAACERFTSAGEELAPLQPSRGPDPDTYITSGWARRVLVRALSRELGLKEPGEYHHQKLPRGGFMLEDDGLIYIGPDDVAPERKHRELVDDFINSEQFSQIVSLMKYLRDLRHQILARIDQCLRKKEYSFNYCPDCPADQARKMLLADK